MVDNCELIPEIDIEDNNELLISELEGMVFLPYTKEDIEEKLKSGKFNSIEEIIEQEYIVPLHKYSDFTGARLREAFKLMRDKEKASIHASIKYATTVMFEKRLHPAIISACRNQDELDIYLACLNDDVLSLFDFFTIKFEYRPLKLVSL